MLFESLKCGTIPEEICFPYCKVTRQHLNLILCKGGGKKPLDTQRCIIIAELLSGGYYSPLEVNLTLKRKIQSHASSDHVV
jgi:hypothetical protein